MALLAIAVPIPAGQTGHWRKFTDELKGHRKAEFVASRKQLGVRERVFFQQTPQGDLVIVTLDGADPAKAFAEFGRATDPFSKWFKQQVLDVHGLDLSAPPPGPMPELVLDSQP